MIFPTLAFQLAYQYPQFRKELIQVLRVKPDFEQESLDSQMKKLIVHPLKTTQIPTLIIIDALDECKDEEPCHRYDFLVRFRNGLTFFKLLFFTWD